MNIKDKKFNPVIIILILLISILSNINLSHSERIDQNNSLPLFSINSSQIPYINILSSFVDSVSGIYIAYLEGQTELKISNFNENRIITWDLGQKTNFEGIRSNPFYKFEDQIYFVYSEHIQGGFVLIESLLSNNKWVENDIITFNNSISSWYFDNESIFILDSNYNLMEYNIFLRQEINNFQLINKDILGDVLANGLFLYNITNVILLLKSDSLDLITLNLNTKKVVIQSLINATNFSYIWPILDTQHNLLIYYYNTSYLNCMELNQNFLNVSLIKSVPSISQPIFIYGNQDELQVIEMNESYLNGNLNRTIFEQYFDVNTNKSINTTMISESVKYAIFENSYLPLPVMTYHFGNMNDNIDTIYMFFLQGNPFLSIPIIKIGFQNDLSILILVTLVVAVAVVLLIIYFFKFRKRLDRKG